MLLKNNEKITLRSLCDVQKPVNGQHQSGNLKATEILNQHDQVETDFHDDEQDDPVKADIHGDKEHGPVTADFHEDEQHDPVKTDIHGDEEHGPVKADFHEDEQHDPVKTDFHEDEQQKREVKLQELRAPRSETAAVCVIVKGVERYIEEWVDYQIYALGFSMVYMYVNEDYFYLEKWASTRSDHLKVFHLPGYQQQLPAYNLCKDYIKENTNHTYAGFYDVDEFLVLKKHEHVIDMLQEHCPSGSLGLNWVFSSQNETDEYRFQPVTKRCKYRQESINHHIKVIAKVSDIDRIEHPHYVRLLHDTAQKDTNGKIFEGPFNDGPEDVAFFFHYRFLSRKEFYESREKGRVDSRPENPSNAELTNAAASGQYVMNDNSPVSTESLFAVFDDSAWRFFTKYVPKYSIFDTW